MRGRWGGVVRESARRALEILIADQEWTAGHYGQAVIDGQVEFSLLAFRAALNALELREILDREDSEGDWFLPDDWSDDDDLHDDGVAPV